jgi:hypothetical protein
VPTAGASASPSAASTVGSPAVAVNPQATGLATPSASASTAPAPDCGGLNR